MHIEEIILEGFKSYASRTVIPGWDPQFNAITGLNGSGKSNILDAICFVLGIGNLGQIRANTLQDLVYKRGQAGINRASVSIVFNNEDPRGSPVGFQDCPQIVVSRQVILGGKNKYLINGVNVPQNRVDSLFQSVQLNVNNPHFLIMQGRITKVLNMKPPEILALIEETAGTRLYEDRKEKAESTMLKKDVKVQEITTTLNEVITPKLDRLREERKAFLEFQVIEADITKYQRIVTAAEYMTLESRLGKARRDFNHIHASLLALKEELAAKEGEFEEVRKLLGELLLARKKVQITHLLSPIILLRPCDACIDMEGMI